MITAPELTTHPDDGDGDTAPALLWRFAAPVRCVASTVLGGGLGERSWVINATVTRGYRDLDPAGHAARIAKTVAVPAGRGAALLTGADVSAFAVATDAGAEAVVTVGLGAVTYAAAPHEERAPWRPGTVNVVAWVPEPVADAALVNLVSTVAEAKAQAFADAGLAGTGTPSDAVVICCPAEPAPDDDDHRYGGPRSAWGARIARASHAAIADGIVRDRAGGR